MGRGYFPLTELLYTVQRLLQLLEQAQLEEIEVNFGGRRILLRRKRGFLVQPGGDFPSSSLEGVQSPSTASPGVRRGEEIGSPKPGVRPAQRAHWVATVAPISGVFWRSPSPGEPPFVEVGDYVEAGQTIGLIEAMKIFSEVPAEASGRVVAIPAREGHIVQQGDPLILIDPDPSWHSVRESL